MQLANSNARYGAVPQLVHWLTALFVICGWLLGTFLDDIPKGPPRAFGLAAHMTLGQCVFVLVLVRLIWRHANPPPAPEKTRFGKALEVIAKLNHYLLYALLIAVPLLGVFVQLKRGNALPVSAICHRHGRPIVPLHASSCACTRSAPMRCLSLPGSTPAQRWCTTMSSVTARSRGCCPAPPDWAQPLSTLRAAAAPARSILRSLDTARNFTPRLASAAARSAEWQ